ncbi:unnamed protein product [Schistocephalus solidus]|uniref:Uncharacterized protein n=1 Tax=Schistocephalus solidus TaxID=70667 RepID=A0A183TS68_SCHSO|nr:unnamed protein product [Schistocephalus solidus]
MRPPCSLAAPGSVTANLANLALPQPYSAETAEVEVVELPRLLLVDCPRLRSTQQRQKYDSFVHLEFGAEVETMSMPDHILHASKGLAGFSDPMGDLIVDFGAA